MGEEVYLQHPRNQTFYKRLCFSSTILGLNAHVWSWYNMPKGYAFFLQRHFVIIAAPSAATLQIIYLCLNYKEHEFGNLSTMVTMLFVTFMVLLQILTAQTETYKTSMVNFMEEIHLYKYFKASNDEFVKKVLVFAEKCSRWTSYYYLILGYVCWFSFEIFPIIHNIQNNESIHNITTRLEIIAHFWMPFDYEFNFYNWFIVQIAMFYTCFIAMSVVIAFDTTNLIFFYHIIGHIQILKHHLKINFKEEMSQEELTQKLIGISRYFTFIVKTMAETEDAFGYNVAGTYCHNLVGGGLFIFQIMASGADASTILTYGLMIPIYMGGLVIMSGVLEDIRTKGDEIPDLLYALEWEKMSLSNQKLVQMMLCQFQYTLEFTAAFNMKTGVQPAISIIKTTFSFYVMIKSRM